VPNEPEDNVSEVISDSVKQEPEQASDDAVVEGDLMSDSVSDVLVEEIASLKEQVLRANAETQNARRRAEQDVEKARKFALEKIVADLLPVADNLERAIAAGDSENESQKAVLEGVALTLKSLQDTLKKYKVEMIDPAGEPFDPQLHQAMTMVPNPDVEPNTVLNVFQKGYTLNGRLVRPAMVVVSKAP
jgi:molecular chaperone GrpE